MKGRNGRFLKCGTALNRGCRCDTCVAWRRYYAKEYDERTKATRRERQRAYRARRAAAGICACGAQGLVSKFMCAACLEALRRRNRIRNTGVCDVKYEMFLETQGRRCAICGGGPSGKGNGRYHVDHDHETGIVRGLLCSKCNVGLGQFDDDPDRLHRAIKYLAKTTDAGTKPAGTHGGGDGGLA